MTPTDRKFLLALSKGVCAAFQGEEQSAIEHFKDAENAIYDEEDLIDLPDENTPEEANILDELEHQEYEEEGEEEEKEEEEEIISSNGQTELDMEEEDEDWDDIDLDFD